MKTTESQEKKIGDYLRSGRSLTQVEALTKFGCFRLAARIYRLRHQHGMLIATQMITTKSGKLVARYSLLHKVS